MGSLSVGNMALAAVPHYLGVGPLWISSWHSEHSGAARPPPLHRVAITLCWESPANKDWEWGWSWPGRSQAALCGLRCTCAVLYRAVWCYMRLYICIYIGVLYGTDRAVQWSAVLYPGFCCSEVLCSTAQRCSVVLCGAVRHHTQLYGTVECYMVLYSATLPAVLHNVGGRCRRWYGATRCCTVLQDIPQCYTRWYSAVNVQCYTTCTATQCCRMLYGATLCCTVLCALPRLRHSSG